MTWRREMKLLEHQYIRIADSKFQMKHRVIAGTTRTKVLTNTD